MQGWQLVPPPWAGREVWVRSTPGSGDPRAAPLPKPEGSRVGAQHPRVSSDPACPSYSSGEHSSHAWVQGAP